MNFEDLNRKLNSVGKTVFVNHFNLFESFAHGRLSREQAMYELVRLGISNQAGAARRIGNAKLIFDAQQEMNAIEIILDAKRISVATREAAVKLQK